jgi:integrase
MAQHVRAPKLDSRSARLKLPIRKGPYFHKIARGLSLAYRRNKTAGTWVVRGTSNGMDWADAIGNADDYQDADGIKVLTFNQAQDAARKRVKIGPSYDASKVGGAIEEYAASLKERGGDDIRNIGRLKKHLPPDLAGKMVGLLVSADLTAFRSSLVGRMAKVSVNRTISILRAALNHAADNSDEKITNRNAWHVGLKALPLDDDDVNVGKAILPEPAIRVIVAQCYAISPQFGEYIETLAVTGTRASQADRLNGPDVEMGRKPRLMMPSSRKGRKKAIRFPVPIPLALAQHLAGRTGRLFSHDGRAFNDWDRRKLFAQAVEAAGYGADAITPYSLRHSSIVRALLANVPIRVVAARHDTSVKQIEATYSRYILDHSDELDRRSILDMTAAPQSPAIAAG